MSAIYGKEAIYQLLEGKGITAKGTVCKNLFLRDAKGKKHFLVTVPEEHGNEIMLVKFD